MITATYSPEDDKIRIYASARLDSETYASVKAAGYGWAPKQGLFYAVWSPRREDLALELAGEIGDEDKSLVERAEERAERFQDYSDNRTQDAEQAHAAVHRISDNIPFGQPILVGHHSEKHARRDAEKIDNGMRRACKMWDTASYWKERAAGALANAKYKELPAVRARRIKTIEAEIRSLIADYTPHVEVGTTMSIGWNWKPSSYDLTPEQREAEEDAARVPHAWVGPKGCGGRWVAVAALPRIEAGNQRSIEHLRNRLAYENGMMAEGDGLAADAFDIQIGGQVTSSRRDWSIVTKLNKKAGKLFSVSVIGKYVSVIPVEEITDYKAPAEGDAEKVKKVKALAPLVNFRREVCIEMTSAEWKQKSQWSDSYQVMGYNAEGVQTFRGPCLYRQRVAGRVNCGSYERVPVFLTDSKETQPPTPIA